MTKTCGTTWYNKYIQLEIAEIIRHKPCKTIDGQFCLPKPAFYTTYFCIRAGHISFFATIVTVWYFLEGGFKGAGQTMVRSKCLTEQKKTNSSPWNGHRMKNLTRFNPINFLDTLSCCCQEKKLEKFGDWIGPVVFICSYVWWPIYQQAGFPLGYFVCLKK